MLNPITRTGQFSSLIELYYDLFNEMGLGVKSNGYLYDQDNGNMLQFDNGKFIKASLNGMEVYAGRNEVVFDPSTNYKLIYHLFGYYLDKCQHDEDGDILQGYVAHYSEDNEIRKQRVVVKTRGRGEISSKYYWCIYLSFIDCIFAIGGYNVDLSMFDVEPEFDKDGKRIRKDK